MRIKNVSGIIWDLDGTLLDSFEIFKQIIVDVVEESGHAMPSHEHMIRNYHGSLEHTIQKILGLESAEEVNKVISLFLEKQEHYYEGDLGTHLFKDATMLAQKAAKLGIHQLLVTNRAHGGRGSASPRAIVAATVLADCIHEVHPGDEVSQLKPDKASVGDWMEKYLVSPKRLIVIGDQFVDAQLAFNLGARALLIKRSGEIPHLETITCGIEDIMIVESLEEIELFQ